VSRKLAQPNRSQTGRQTTRSRLEESQGRENGPDSLKGVISCPELGRRVDGGDGDLDVL
jgi:hypothetical protein